MNYGLLLVYIYCRSVIDVESHYKLSALLTYKTSTSEIELAELPYWRFHNLSVYVEELLKQENGESGGEDNQRVEELQGNIQSNAKSMMNGMKSTIGSFKAPKMK